MPATRDNRWGMSVDDDGMPLFRPYWKDILGNVALHGTAANDPAPANYRGTIRQFQFDLNEEVYNEFHMPHDYCPGTDLYMHVHWSVNEADVASGTVTWTFDISYAKGHGQGQFSAPIAIPVTQALGTYGPGGQYLHMIAEVKISTPGGAGGTLVDTNLLEPDGILMVRTKLTANSLSPASAPFAHFVDVHYLADRLGTLNKAPDFYD